MAAMILAILLDSNTGQSITPRSSPGMNCMSVAIKNTIMIVQIPYFDCFGFVIGKIERSEMAAMMFADSLDSF